MDQVDKLTAQLLHARNMEKKAIARVKRASTILLTWSKRRARIEGKLGAAEVQRIVNRLTQVKE